MNDSIFSGNEQQKVCLITLRCWYSYPFFALLRSCVTFAFVFLTPTCLCSWLKFLNITDK